MVTKSTRRLTRCLWAVVLPAATLVGPAAPVAAQVQLNGRVIDDESEHPIEGARVTLLGLQEEPLQLRYSNGQGNFDFTVRGRQAVRLRVERIGYLGTTTSTLEFREQHFFRIQIRLRTDAVSLTPLTVVSRLDSRPSRVLEGFEQRRANGLGQYLTRADIEERRPALVSDLLSEVPGVRVLPTGGRRVVAMGRSGGRRDCPSQIYVDGFHINRRVVGGPSPELNLFTIDDVVTPESIEAIEVYRGIATVPAEFLSRDAVCGVVVIWTRRGNT